MMATEAVACNVRPCQSFPGYSASEDGRVFSRKVRRGLGRGRGTTWDVVAGVVRELPQAASDKSHGRLSVSVWTDNSRRRVSVHLLVLDAFAGPRPAPHLQARHLDGNHLNNSAENLAWGTVLENTQDKFKHGTVLAGERHPRAKLTRAQVNDIRERGDRGESFASLGRAFNVSTGQARRIVRRKAWKQEEVTHGA